MTTFRNVKVQVKKLHENATLPTYGSAEAAGADLYARLEADVILMPGERTLIPTGIAVELPVGYELQVRPRSGLALKHGLTIVNSPGTVDSDYRGDVSVMLLNTGHQPFVVTHGMRIAQAVIAPVVRAEFLEATSLGSSERGTSGFGSTGV